MLTITIADLRDFEACDLAPRVESLVAVLHRTPADDEQIPLITFAPFTSMHDLIWALRIPANGPRVAAAFAQNCADRAIFILSPEQEWAAVPCSDLAHQASIHARRAEDPNASPYTREYGREEATWAARAAAEALSRVVDGLFVGEIATEYHAARNAELTRQRQDLLLLIGGA